jgi:hypothetical protein
LSDFTDIGDHGVSIAGVPLDTAGMMMRGTGSSNPASSSGESIANLTAAYMVGGLFAFMMLSGRVAQPLVGLARIRARISASRR